MIYSYFLFDYTNVFISWDQLSIGMGLKNNLSIIKN